LQDFMKCFKYPSFGHHSQFLILAILFFLQQLINCLNFYIKIMYLHIKIKNLIKYTNQNT
jgi:hypothetical protein